MFKLKVQLRWLRILLRIMVYSFSPALVYVWRDALFNLVVFDLSSSLDTQSVGIEHKKTKD